MATLFVWQLVEELLPTNGRFHFGVFMYGSQSTLWLVQINFNVCKLVGIINVVYHE